MKCLITLAQVGTSDMGMKPSELVCLCCSSRLMFEPCVFFMLSIICLLADLLYNVVL